ncbi:hypothetical protein ACFLXT_01640 [Chloroflexota bacterium]
MSIETLVKGLLVLDPTTEPEPMQATIAVRPHTLDSKVVGLLDNAKPNSDRILDMVGELLAKKYHLARVVKVRKPSATRGAPQEMLDEMAEECNVAIAGVGD